MDFAGLRWVASPIINKLLTNASTYLNVDMVRELQQLEATVLPQFDLVIQAAEKSPHRGKLEAWLRRLKEAFYDAEGLLDEHEYNLVKRKAKSGKDPMVPGEDESSSIPSTSMKPLRAAKSRARNVLPTNKRLISKMNELKAILTEAKELRDLLSIPAESENTTGLTCPAVPTTIVPPTTVTSLCTSKVFGRDKDRDRIVNFLLGKTIAVEESSTRYSSLAIVGAGGMGKSTLAQFVYNDKRIEEAFDVRMWVCISHKLDVRRHTREIIESATNGECPSIDNLDALQCKLRDVLQKSEKFLLVLDDVWFEKSDSETEWFQLLDPLVSKHSGSKVLVTSRRATLPVAVCCEQIVIHLENMDDADFLALFKHHAFLGAKIEDQIMCSWLEHTAEEIAQRLGQCPLAAKVLGSRLSRKKDIVEWKAALKLTDLSEIFTGLLWSYEKLDPRLQRCFLYCSLFPKGHRYKPDELVHHWVAEGFVGSCNSSRKTLEDIGMDYFNDMVSGSFFQLVSERHDSYYVMHDILHDLAESLSREDCFRLEDDHVTEIPRTVRYLSVSVQSMQRHKQIIYKLHHLRTVICIDPLTDNASVIFDQLLKFRVLDLSFYNSSKLPESVGKLKHLRYLDLSRTSISNLSGCSGLEQLPESFGNLTRLLHINLSGCSGLVKLPESFGNLTRVLHINLSGCSGLKNLPKSFGNLTGVVHINLSGCHGIDDLPKSFCRLSNLEYLDLSFCSCPSELQTALGGLTNLRHLNLSHPSCYAVKHKDHLEQLKDVWAKLKKLHYLNLSMFTNPIFCYLPEGESSLDCFQSIFKGLSSLEHLDLSHNIFLVDLPETLCDLSRLHTLNLYGCRRLKRIAKKDS